MSARSGLRDILPLSPLQEGLFFMSSYDDAEQLDVYTVQQVIRLAGPVDPARLRAAAEALLRRHPNLRAAFRQRKNGNPVALVPHEVDLPWTEVDLSTLDGAAQEAEEARLAAAERAERFDLGRPPLLRWTLLLRGPDAATLVLTSHHLLLDGWSSPLLVRDLLALYTNGADESALPRVRPYRDYLVWLAQQDGPTALAAWRGALAGLAEPTLFAPGGPTAAALPHRAHLALSEELTARLVELGRGLGVTVNTVVQAAWGLLLARLTGRTDVVFGSTVSGRPATLPGVEDMVGLFINTLPVRVRLDPAETWAELLGRLQGEQAALLEHQHVRLADVQRQVGLGTLFDSLIVFESYPMDSDALDASQDAAGLRVSEVVGHDATHYPLTLTVLPDRAISFEVEYHEGAFGADGARRVLDRLGALLTGLAADPHRRIGATDVLLPGERSLLSGPELAVPDGNLIDVLRRQAAATPDATAVVCAGDALTFAELLDRVDGLARALVAAGVTPESPVAVLLPRSVDSVVAWLAALASGGAHLPVDADYPAARIDAMLADAAPAVLVSTPELRRAGPVHVLPDATGTADLPTVHPASAAYVIYTSGSTGTPKGVVVEHRQLTHYLAHVRSALVGPLAGDRTRRVALSASLSFDTSWETLLWLFAGHELHLLDEETRKDPDLFTGYVATHGIDVLDLTPSFAVAMVDAGLLDGPGAPGLLLLGGEATGPALWTRVRDAPGTVGVNLYGPTECTVDTLMAHLADSPEPLVGAPIANTRAYVLDAHLLPVPAGVPGELYLAGAQLGRGYLGRPGLTAGRFVADPAGPPGARMYRTGDLVRHTDDGRLDFLGRTDDQVKVRGHRIEPGEVEAVLAADPEVTRAVVTVREDTPGLRRLVGYVTGTADPAALRDRVARVLPEHLVPAAIVVLDAVPLTVAGKVDRAALPAPEFASGGGAQPRTPLEKVLCEVCAEALGLPSIGVDDSFFALGGDSIVSIQFVARARAAGVRITPRQVFERRTVAALADVAAFLDTAAPARAEPADAHGDVPVTPVLASFAASGAPLAGYTQSMVLRVPADLNPAALAAATQALLDRHDLLRARWTDGRLVVPAAGPRATTLLRRVNAAGLHLDACVATEVRDAAARLDPAAGTMVQVVWCDAGPRPGRLVLVAHHLVVDGVSWRILVPDLAGAYEAAAAGKEPTLAPVGTSFRRWARDLAAAAAARETELPLWRALLAGPDRQLGTRPVDPARDTVASTATVTVELAPGHTAPLLTRVPEAFHAGVQDVLLTGLARALRNRTGGPALIELEGHGREEHLVPGADLSRTVGWFTTEYPVRLDPGAGDLASAVKRVKEQLRAVPDAGIGYGLLRHLNPATAAELAALPEPQVLFNYLGRFGTGDEPEADWTPVGGLGGDVDPTTPAARVLEINASVLDGPDGPRLTATLSYPDGVLTGADVRALAADWLAALAELSALTTGGRTPSDLPLVDLGQAEIEALERGTPDLADVWPLSPLQAGLFFLTSYDTDSVDPYVVQQTLDLAGPVDAGRLRAAAQALLDRHPNLRAGFHQRADGRPVQVIPAHTPVGWAERDLSHLPAPERDAALRRLTAEDLGTRFDVDRPPLLRFLLVKLADDRHQLVMTNHHLLLDGWSTPLAVRDLLSLYGGATLPRVRPYRDHLAWLAGIDPAASEAAWREALAGLEEPTLVAGGANSAAEARPGHVDVALDPAVADRLTAWARHRGVTLNTVTQTVWAVLLGRLTGRDDVVFGSTVSGRPAHLSGVEDMVGFFINTVPVRVRTRTADTWADLVGRVQAEQAALLDHQHVGLGDTQRIAGLGELFDTLTLFESYPLDEEALDDSQAAAGLRVTGVDGDDAPHYPLTLTVAPGEELRFGLAYRRDLFTDERAATLLDRVVRLVTELADRPDAVVAHTDIVDAAERDRLLAAGAGAARPVSGDTLVTLFDRQVEATPDATALVTDGERVSYRDLARRVGSLAHVLRERGVRPGDIVAVAVPRSVDLVVALYAVQRAGAAYLPVDTELPAARIGMLVADSGATVVVTTGELAAASAPAPTPGAPATGTPVLVLDDPATVAALAVAPATPAVALPADAPAYVIYTSGSTGRPKGVVVGHRAIVNRLSWTQAEYGLTPGERVLQKTPASFDVSVWEFFWPLVTGATLVLARPDGHRDPGYLADLIRRHQVGTVHFVPSMLRAFLAVPDQVAGLGLRRVLCSGEGLPADLAAEAERVLGTDVHNLYGPTEAAVDVSYRPARPVPAEGLVPIGRPVWNTGLLILDQHLRPLPAGVEGELYLTGVQLAHGYLNRPGLTAERFVANPFGTGTGGTPDTTGTGSRETATGAGNGGTATAAGSGDTPDLAAPGSRMYRTGDRARWNAAGEVEYLGRSDDQVKVRGIRIEPGEAEAALAGCPGVAHAVVLARRDAGATDATLVGYVVPSGPVPEEEALRTHLAATLPDHLVPTAFVFLTALPVTANGKLDRRALPAPDFAARAGSDEPRDDTERLLAGLFAEVLGVPAVGVRDSFFRLGGDSIMSIQLVARARAAGLRITPREIFDRRTVADLARVATALAAPTAEPADAGLGPVPSTPVIAAHTTAPFDRLSQSTQLTLPVGIGASDLAAVLRRIVDHHDLLRSRWTADGLEVRPPGTVDVPLRRVDTAGLAPDRLRDLADRETSDAVARLAPRAGAMVQAVWCDAGPDVAGRLILAVHHLAVDGVSWRILGPDLAAAWDQVTGAGPGPAPVGTSFRGWARGLAAAATSPARVAELDHWRDTLTGPAAYADRRPDPARDTLDTVVGVSRRLDAHRTAPLLGAVPDRFHTGVREVVLTGLALAAGDHVLVELEGHGREEAAVAGADLSRTVGWFTSEYPVRFAVDGADPGAALRHVKERLRAAPDSGIGYGLLRWLNPATASVLAPLPTPPILFNYLGRFDGAGDADDAPWTPVRESEVFGGDADGSAPARHAFSAEVTVVPGADGPELVLALSYPSRLVSGTEAGDLADRWVAALGTLVGAAGGHSPSDFALVDLTQAEVTGLEAAHPDLVDIVPLTPLQRGLHFLSSLGDGADVYLVQQRLDLDGPLDATRLRAAAQGLLDRHPNLRAGFTQTADGTVVSVVPATAAVPWTEHDLTHLAPDARALAVEAVADAEFGRPFDLAAPPLLRCVLLRLGPDRAQLVLTQHHLLVDGWSGPLVAAELLSGYGGAPAPRPRPYRDFLTWLSTQDTAAAGRAWSAALDGAEPTLLAPARPGTGVVPAEVSTALPTGTADLARSLGLTVNTLVQGLWGLLLARLTNRNDVVFGATVSGRPADLAGAGDMIGLFINTVPVRVRLAAGETWRQYLDGIQSAQAGLLEHHHLGLADIQREHGALFDTLLVFESYPVDEDLLAEGQRAAGLRLSGVTGRDATHYPLTLVAVEDEGVHVTLEYRPDLYDAPAARTLLDRLVGLATRLAADPDAPLDAVDALTAEERPRIHGAGPVLPVRPVTVGALVAEHAAATPDAGALVCGDTRLTYAELDSAANRLAGLLVAAGVTCESRVGLVLPRGVEIVTAILAVLKAGGAYVPVDPDYPAERIAFLLADTAPAVVVTDREHAHAVPAGLRTLVLDDPETARARAAAPDVAPAAPRPDNAAYVIHTSGSTGQPKGVVVAHRNLVNLFGSHDRSILGPAVAARGGRPLRIAHNWSFSFDASWQPLLALLGGHELHLVTGETRKDPGLLVGLLRDRGIDMVEVAPSHLEQLIDAGLFTSAGAEGSAESAGHGGGSGADPGGLSTSGGAAASDNAATGAPGIGGGETCGLAVLGVGGEAVPTRLWDRLRALTGTEAYNFYGPTECTVDTVVQRVREADRPLIGHPVANTGLHVLDDGLRPVPPGTAGELYLSGAALARGYAGQPGLTATRFVASPFAPGARMYRTGDLVRQTPDGRIDYLGRADDQVKVRGFRIEPGEVEAALTARPDIARAAVDVREDTPGVRRLVGYVVPEAGHAPDPATVRAELAAVLPGHLVPAAVVCLPALPVTANGKLDRSALPRPDLAGLAAGREPAGPAEAAWCAAFAEVLDLPGVGADTGFFDLGGDSLAAMRLVTAARRHGLTLRLRDLFELRTPAALAGATGSAPAPTGSPVSAPAATGSTATAVGSTVATSASAPTTRLPDSGDTA
ncbi:amino acid adenylation domain-containing protein [Longispora sp. NPDC051575]|uniref:amino acid adenylation domain-containing protein n=1 Tax=Longispora sp. NPDC051575 TaxID=3154943 RepID=UPI0034198FC4